MYNDFSHKMELILLGHNLKGWKWYQLVTYKIYTLQLANLLQRYYKVSTLCRWVQMQSKNPRRRRRIIWSWKCSFYESWIKQWAAKVNFINGTALFWKQARKHNNFHWQQRLCHFTNDCRNQDSRQINRNPRNSQANQLLMRKSLQVVAKPWRRGNPNL